MPLAQIHGQGAKIGFDHAQANAVFIGIAPGEGGIAWLQLDAGQVQPFDPSPKA